MCAVCVWQEEKEIRGVTKLISLATNTKGCLFTTKVLKGLSEAYQEANREYEQCQQGLVAKCVDVVGKAAPFKPCC